MDLKLQQAIVATKAGRTDIAQNLLTQLIHDNPNDANAWFLLGHLVDTPERQSLYLQKTVELDPNHAIAKQQLVQLANPPVPAPVLPQENSQAVARDEASLDLQAAESVSVNEAAEGLSDLEDDQKGINPVHDDSWQELVSEPIRETQYDSQQTSPPALTHQKAQTNEPSGTRTSGDVWLVRILVIMVIVAAIVLGILVLLLLI